MVILVPGDGESPDWPQAIGPLRRKLPDAGWQTLSLALPDPQSTAPVTRPAESAASASADKDASAADSASKPDVKGESGNAPAPESTAEAGSGEPAQSEDQALPSHRSGRAAQGARRTGHGAPAGEHRPGPAARTEKRRPARSWHGRLLGGTLPGGEGACGNPQPAAGCRGGTARFSPGAGRYGAEAETGDRRLLLPRRPRRPRGGQAAHAGRQAAETPGLRTNRDAGATGRPQGGAGATVPTRSAAGSAFTCRPMRRNLRSDQRNPHALGPGRRPPAIHGFSR